MTSAISVPSTTPPVCASSQISIKHARQAPPPSGSAARALPIKTRHTSSRPRRGSYIHIGRDTGGMESKKRDTGGIHTHKIKSATDRCRAKLVSGSRPKKARWLHAGRGGVARLPPPADRDASCMLGFLLAASSKTRARRRSQLPAALPWWGPGSPCLCLIAFPVRFFHAT